jgi:ADP-L-glycero-D-manno-heptose 6-epimerase
MAGRFSFNSSILLTGAGGFIGSYLLGFLNKRGYSNIIIADDFNDEDKWFNFDPKNFSEKIDREELFNWLSEQETAVDYVIHLGARTDTTEFDYSILERLNIEYSRKLWDYCSRNKVPFIYASSAATYGSGELGYDDDHEIVEKLSPLNPYGISKNEFDKWVLKQVMNPPDLGKPAPQPPFWAGLKFFNVYGPNEYHKGRMASMVFHGFNQIRKTGKVRLFRSHRPDVKDGEQLRDFIYVKDVAEVISWIMEESMAADRHPLLSSAIYNLGTGRARSFIDLVTPVFNSLGLPVNIEYIDIPEDIRDRYQYFTQANMNKLLSVGYVTPFCSVEEGVSDYVKNYLIPQRYF